MVLSFYIILMLLIVHGIDILYNINKMSLAIHRSSFLFLSKLSFCHFGSVRGCPNLILNFENLKQLLYPIDQIIILPKEEKSKSKALSIQKIFWKPKISLIIILPYFASSASAFFGSPWLGENEIKDVTKI